MLALFHAFSLKSTQIQQAIRLGDDALVGTLDHDLEELVSAILAYSARSALEVYMQLQFMLNLIRETPEDRESVVRNATALSSLLNRYFTGAKGAAAEALLGSAPFDMPPAEPFAHAGALSDVILDRLPERIAIITRDYRYLYSNAAHAAAHAVKPIQLIGRHVADFIGRQRFENRARAKLDSCFSGETVNCRMEMENDAKTVTKCELSPVRTANGEIIGALVVLRDVSVEADMLAA